MPENTHRIDVRDWVHKVQNDPVEWRRRQATEIILTALASLLPRYEFHLKGGLLMGLVHESPRMTTDINLSANFPPEPESRDVVRSSLDAALRTATARLGYVDLVVSVHSAKELPKGKFNETQFPALQIKIVHSGRQVVRAGKPPDRNFLDIDISFNEVLCSVDVLQFFGEETLLAYSLADLIAEKYRALLQQVPRRRRRHQDVYDIHYLLTGHEANAALRREIFESMLAKCRSRGIEPDRNSLNNPEIRQRAEAEWGTLSLELGAHPRFARCYELVRRFYEDLPWPEFGGQGN